MSPTPEHTPGDVTCEDAGLPRLGGLVQSLFPPAGADDDTRRAWLASSPWPEVVFACAS